MSYDVIFIKSKDRTCKGKSERLRNVKCLNFVFIDKILSQTLSEVLTATMQEIGHARTS